MIAKRFQSLFERLMTTECERSQLRFQVRAAVFADSFFANAAPFGSRLRKGEQIFQITGSFDFARPASDRASGEVTEIEPPNTLIVVGDKETAVRRDLDINQGKVDEFSSPISGTWFRSGQRFL